MNMNPILPGYEYIPDGEPRIFNGRVYVYGSHDRFHSKMFCLNDYVCWSAPIEDLCDWRYEGVIYRKSQDPKNRMGIRLLFAPDVVQGKDSLFYLYYAFDFMGMIGVAVSEKPEGPFQFLGHVKYKEGTIWGRKRGDAFPFDPGVLVDDDGRIYLYSGFYTKVPSVLTGGKKLLFEGGYVVELESDMCTIKEPQKLLFPKEGANSFAEHEFFEASSIRKYHDKYFFVYSSKHNHELCYAISDYPNKGFTFGGTLISNGDVFLPGIDVEEKAKNYLGNNHGGMLNVNENYYIFYHRHTDRSSYSRQVCVEKLTGSPTCGFSQVEMTSLGFRERPFDVPGHFETRMACNLWSKEGVGRYDIKHAKKRYREHPYFTQNTLDGDEDAIQYIANIKDGATAGFKYFELCGELKFSIEITGHANGVMKISTDSDFATCFCKIPIEIHQKQKKIFSSNCDYTINEQKIPLYFCFSGEGTIDFYSFQVCKI